MQKREKGSIVDDEEIEEEYRKRCQKNIFFYVLKLNETIIPYKIIIRRFKTLAFGFNTGQSGMISASDGRLDLSS